MLRSTKQKPLTKVRGFFVASAAVSCQSRTVQDSNRAALTTPVGRVSNQPSATTTTAACGRNREELLGPRSDFSKPRQGAVEKSANATRCCCLARGSWTPRNVYQERCRPTHSVRGFFCCVIPQPALARGGTGRGPERTKAGYHHGGGALPFSHLGWSFG